jgi:hypothetical protein
MGRLLIATALIVTLSGCAGVTFSHTDDMHSLEYRTAVPAVTIGIDADCKTSSQVVTIPGPARYISFKEGLGKADTSVDFGPGGTIAKFNSKTEGAVDDALKIASTVMSAAGMTAGLDAGTKGANGNEAPKCKPLLATYLIDYDPAGRPSVDSSKPFFLKTFDAPEKPPSDKK